MFFKILTMALSAITLQGQPTQRSGEKRSIYGRIKMKRKKTEVLLRRRRQLLVEYMLISERPDFTNLNTYLSRGAAILLNWRAVRSF